MQTQERLIDSFTFDCPSPAPQAGSFPTCDVSTTAQHSTTTHGVAAVAAALHARKRIEQHERHILCVLGEHVHLTEGSYHCSCLLLV